MKSSHRKNVGRIALEVGDVIATGRTCPIGTGMNPLGFRGQTNLKPLAP